MSAFYKEGRYKGEIVNQALGKNTNTGTPQFVLKFRVMCEVLGDQEANVRKQYERSVYMYLSDRAAPHTIKKLQEIGFDGSSIRQLDLNQATHHSFVGQCLEFDCSHEEGNDGEIREKWDLAYKGGNGDIENIKPLEASEARKLDSLFARSLGPGKSYPKQATTPARSATTADPISDDDVPF